MPRHGLLVRVVSSWMGNVTSQRSFSSRRLMSAAAGTRNLGQTKGAAATSASPEPGCKSHLAMAMERGAYDERTIPRVATSRVQQVSLTSDGKNVELTWEDGKVSRFHSLWLRHTCFCHQCKFDANGQPHMAYDNIPSDLRLQSAVDDGEGSLVVHWQGEEKHTGVFPLKFLRFHCYSPQSIDELRENIKMRYSTDTTTIPRVTFEEVMEGDQGVLRWMTFLNERGICLVEGVPTESGMVRKTCERIFRSVMPTIYGFTEDVKSLHQPMNAAYSPEGLQLHQDLVYYASPPGLQALHCMKFDEGIEGGNNVFADMFHVADTFRERHPDDFHVLSTVPATLDTIHYRREWPVHMNVKRPMITLNDHGDLVGVRYQPHHLGPLQVKEEFIEPFYAAYKKFYIMTKTWPHMYQYRLRVGDMITYNNRRMTHGRTEYTFQEGQERHLQGCYMNVSELKSRMQSLSNLIGDGRVVQRIGDYDYM